MSKEILKVGEKGVISAVYQKRTILEYIVGEWSNSRTTISKKKSFFQFLVSKMTNLK